MGQKKIGTKGRMGGRTYVLPLQKLLPMRRLFLPIVFLLGSVVSLNAQDIWVNRVTTLYERPASSWSEGEAPGVPTPGPGNLERDCLGLRRTCRKPEQLGRAPRRLGLARRLQSPEAHVLTDWSTS